MRPGQQNKRGRGRGGNGGGGNFNRKGANPLTRTYDSSGPDVKIRGTAQHIAEKYAALARDAQSSGDRVMAENYLQHAEHYNRIIAAAQAQMQERFQRDDRGDYADRDVDDMDILDEPAVHHAAPAQAAPRPVEIAGSGPQPVIEGTPVEVSAAEEAAEEGGEQRQSRRRNSGSRPRRQRRGGGAGTQGEDAGDAGSAGAESSSEKPELAAAASE